MLFLSSKVARLAALSSRYATAGSRHLRSNHPFLLDVSLFCSKASGSSHDESCLTNNGEAELVNTVAYTTATAISDEKTVDLDWNDRIGLQNKWSNPKKGWKVAVEWRQTQFGAGLFALEDVPKDTILRVGQNGVNLLEFESVEDIEAFCGDSKEARLLYVKDYLWGFNPNADERGYTTATPSQEDRFVGMWIPGNGLNHNEEPNTVYRPHPTGGTSVGIHLVALDDVRKGDELTDDYRRHGTAPIWLQDFCQEYNVSSLNFADCNDFVNESK